MERDTLVTPMAMEFKSNIGETLDGLTLPHPERLSIPQSVFDSLPGLLRDICGYFATGFERDIFLTSALVVCSGILSRVKFRHRDKWYHLNLYALITADAGSGKGDAGLAWDLAKGIDRRLYEESQRSVADWELQKEEVEAVKARNRKRKKDEPAEPVPDLLPKPPIRTLRIAVNSSARAFVDRLASNRGEGLVLDTEIKTLLLARKQEWGDTEAYLKGFHNEPINIDRAGGVCVRIDEPSFAACLTGTPDAMRRLITSAEDGLFSRFMHYTFTAPVEWRSHRPTANDESRDGEIAQCAEALDQLHRYLSERDDLLYGFFSQEQWDRIDAAFGGSLEAMNASGSEKILFASVRRAGLIAERIACILSVLRHFERGQLTDQRKSIRLEAEDIECGIELGQTYLAHALEVARLLPMASNAHIAGTTLRILSTLSDEPVTVQEIADRLGISVRTVQYHLKSLQELSLARGLTDKGPYVRANLQTNTGCVSCASCALDEFEPPNESETQKTQNAQSAGDGNCDEYGDGELAF